MGYSAGVGSLLEKGLLSESELSAATDEQVSQLTTRAPRLWNSQDGSGKVKTILGLPRPQGKKPTKEIAMRVNDLARAIQQRTGSRVAIVLYGSRLNPGMAPRNESDLDVMVAVGGRRINRKSVVEATREIGRRMLRVEVGCEEIYPASKFENLERSAPDFWRGHLIGPETCAIGGDPIIARRLRRSIQRSR